MRIDQTDFRNCLATLNVFLPHSSGIDADAYGAMLGLIGFRWLKPQARQAWDMACFKTIQQFPGGVEHGFFWQLRTLRQWAFGTGIDQASVNNGNVVTYPWSLSDGEFIYCYQQVADGNMPSLQDLTKGGIEKVLTPGVVVAGSAAAGILQLAMKGFLKKAMPDIVDFVVTKAERSVWPIAIATEAYKVTQYAANTSNVKVLRQRYGVDAKRREYLKLKGKSTFSGLLVPGGGRQ